MARAPVPGRSYNIIVQYKRTGAVPQIHLPWGLSNLSRPYNTKRGLQSVAIKSSSVIRSTDPKATKARIPNKGAATRSGPLFDVTHGGGIYRGPVG